MKLFDGFPPAFKKHEIRFIRHNRAINNKYNQKT